MSNLISYEYILKDRDNFRKSGTSYGNNFNLLDTPGLKYFKLFFYFNNGDVDNQDSSTISNGLLAPTWLDEIPTDQLYMQNSAWAYLKLNDEEERAELLENFVNLLSNISSESPWYFSEISGLDEALTRKITMDKEFKIDEERGKITIKCLPDSFDDRIATLLDLYRSIVWSWTSKREILPANLKKFDMGILIFESPNFPFHYINNYANIGIGDSSTYKTSYKYIEFHNCEIDYNSSKGNFGTINNSEGLIPEYSIELYFDDCYETRYNESAMHEFGDMILSDIISTGEIKKQENQIQVNGLDERMAFYSKSTENNQVVQNQELIDKSLPGYEGSKSLTRSNIINQLLSVGNDAITGIMKKAVLGNLYTFSLTRIGDQINSAMNGNIWSTIRGVNEYINDSRQREEHGIPVVNSLFKKPTRVTKTVERLGNLFESNTLAENL